MRQQPIDRRGLLLGGGLAVAGLANASASPRSAAPSRAARQDPAPSDGRFKLDYAPHFGMFRHHGGDDLLDQLRFMHDEGFRSLEDNGMRGRSVETQEAIGNELARLGMRMGVFVLNSNGFGRPSFSGGGQDDRETFLRECRQAVEIQARVNAQWCTVVCGDVHPRLAPGYQFANVVDTLRMGAEILEPTGLTMVLEPLNPLRDHPGQWLTRVPQAYSVCRAVDSPSVKILDDLYHQQITEGNLIPNIDQAWSEIGYIQVGDHPGRREPGTGEINYQNVFRHLHRKGYTGIVGMEHGNSQGGRDGERAVIDAYVWADSFE